MCIRDSPGTVLTTTYNADNQAVSVKVETPASETSTTPVVAEANLTTNEVTVNGQSVVAADLTAPVETVSTTAVSYTHLDVYKRQRCRCATL